MGAQEHRIRHYQSASCRRRESAKPKTLANVKYWTEGASINRDLIPFGMPLIHITSWQGRHAPLCCSHFKVSLELRKSSKHILRRRVRACRRHKQPGNKENEQMMFVSWWEESFSFRLLPSETVCGKGDAEKWPCTKCHKGDFFPFINIPSQSYLGHHYRIPNGHKGNHGPPGPMGHPQLLVGVATWNLSLPWMT